MFALTGKNVLLVSALLSTEQPIGYVQIESDNQKIGFLVFHYGAETNLREYPSSGYYLG